MTPRLGFGRGFGAALRFRLRQRRPARCRRRSRPWWRANTGFAAGYGADHVGARAADLIRALLDADAEVRFVASGTAANALTLAALAAPHEAVICHEDSPHRHRRDRRAGLLRRRRRPDQAGRRLRPHRPGGAGARRCGAADSAHHQSPAALSITNTTEFGALYAEAASAALVGAAKAAGLKTHLDGARLANAAASGFDPKAVARLGFDVAVVGGTKAGGTPTEAIVLFDKALARRFDARMKHAGQLVSKGRFLAAPWIGMLESGAWIRRAAHANAMAPGSPPRCRSGSCTRSSPTACSSRWTSRRSKRLQAAGWFVYRFIDGSVRFMCSWATTEAAVEELGETLKAIA